MIISRLILLRMRNVSNKCRESQNTFHIPQRFAQNHAVCEIMSKNVMEPERSQMIMQYGAYASHAGLSKATVLSRTRLNVALYVHCVYFYVADIDYVFRPSRVVVSWCNTKYICYLYETKHNDFFF